MMLNRFSQLAVIALVAMATGFVSSGCNSGPSQPQSIGDEAQVNNIVEMRQIFDKVKGDWNALSEADRAQYTKLAGSEEQAKKMWENMGRPAGAAASGGAG